MDGLKFARLVVKRVEEDTSKIKENTPLYGSMEGEVKKITFALPMNDSGYAKDGLLPKLVLVADEKSVNESMREFALDFYKKMKKTSKNRWSNVLLAFGKDSVFDDSREIVEVISTRNGLILCDKTSVSFLERNGLKIPESSSGDEIVKVREDGAEAASGIFSGQAKPTCVNDVLGKTDFADSDSGIFGKDDFHIPQNMLSGEVLRRTDY